MSRIQNWPRNFLVIAPNIIVLDRLRTDFDGLKYLQTIRCCPTTAMKGELAG